MRLQGKAALGLQATPPPLAPRDEQFIAWWPGWGVVYYTGLVVLYYTCLRCSCQGGQSASLCFQTYDKSPPFIFPSIFLAEPQVFTKAVKFCDISVYWIVACLEHFRSVQTRLQLDSPCPDLVHVCGTCPDFRLHGLLAYPLPTRRCFVIK